MNAFLTAPLLRLMQNVNVAANAPFNGRNTRMVPADPCAIHRPDNLGTRPAVAPHVHRVAFDGLDSGVGRVCVA